MLDCFRGMSQVFFCSHIDVADVLPIQVQHFTCAPVSYNLKKSKRRPGNGMQLSATWGGLRLVGREA
jgi:hypothetical protein